MNTLIIAAKFAEAQHSRLRMTADDQGNRTLELEDQPLTPQNCQPIPDSAETSAVSKTLTAQLKPWEVDLANFLPVSGTGKNIRWGGRRAQEFVKKLDVVRRSALQVFSIP